MENMALTKGELAAAGKFPETIAQVKKPLCSEVLPCLLKTLTRDNIPKLILESAWALANIAATKYTSAMVDASPVPVLVKLHLHQIPTVHEQSTRCLGELARESPSP
eukprot:CCRYP_001813-RA/>CCRYP_001813-RA protein AED:0.16 eAED:-0.20 QI:0/-1/0/1/-1/1/1/0/106